MRNQVVDRVTENAILQFVIERNLPRWYAGEIARAEQQGLSDEDIALLFAPRVAAATLAYRQWEGAM